jgi:hypothetical protein
MNPLRVNALLRWSTLLVLFFPPLAFADGYLKSPYAETGPLPPDANKPATGADISCWLATAANMLAGAGYGTSGNTVQERAEEIYTQFKNSPEMQSYG